MMMDRSNLPASDTEQSTQRGDPEGWEQVRRWRRATRAKLLARRLAVAQGERDATRVGVTALILEHARKQLVAGCVGFYWPFKREIDLRHVVRHLIDAGAVAALPVVVERARPVEFWAWQPRTKLARGIWNIPIPAERQVVQPAILLVPLLGFDGAGYRLGYGGGYYDRTLAATTPRPITIGIGYEHGRLDTIFPQPHDIPMDATVTEAGMVWHRSCPAAPHPESAARQPVYDGDRWNG